MQRGLHRTAAAMASSAAANKLTGHAWWQSMGSPRLCVAPMVDGSELAFRLLCKEFGAQLTWTPMLHARITVETEGKYLTSHFSSCEHDRPVIAQFASDDPDILMKAAQMVQDKVDAIDINLGCPQNIAKRGHYGAFLLDEPDLIVAMVERLHATLSVPVTCKIRILPTKEATLCLCHRLEAAGCSLLTVHGRLRSNMKLGITGADWDIIREIKAAVGIPVVANGSIACADDVHACLAATGVDGVMVSEAILENPGMFSDNVPTSGPLRERLDALLSSPATALVGADVPRVHGLELTKRYLQISRVHKSNWSIVKAHVIKTSFGVFRSNPAYQSAYLAALDAGNGRWERDWAGAIDALLEAVRGVQEAYERDVVPEIAAQGLCPPSGFFLREGYNVALSTRQRAFAHAREEARRLEPTAAWCSPEYLWDPAVPGAWYMRHRKEAYGGAGVREGARVLAARAAGAGGAVPAEGAVGGAGAMPHSETGRDAGVASRKTDAGVGASAAPAMVVQTWGEPEPHAIAVRAGAGRRKRQEEAHPLTAPALRHRDEPCGAEG